MQSGGEDKRQISARLAAFAITRELFTPFGFPASSSLCLPYIHCAHRPGVFDHPLYLPHQGGGDKAKLYGVGNTGVGMTNGVSVGYGVAVPSGVGSGVEVG